MPIVSMIKDRPVGLQHQFPEDEGRKVKYLSRDSLELVGFWSHPVQGKGRGIIILLHGIRSGKEAYINLSKRLSREGYHSIALDLRGHGESGGRHCAFGVKEKDDVSALIDYLHSTEGQGLPIGIWGRSLGGAVGLQALGYDDRITFGVIESTFSDFRAIVHDYFSYHAGFNIPWFTNYLVDRAAAIAGFDPAEASPRRYCEKIEQPVLLVHGDTDKRIDVKYALENYTSMSSVQKYWLVVEGAGHLNVWEIGGERYFEKVLDFMATQVGAEVLHED